jgi:hypothetical protein
MIWQFSSTWVYSSHSLYRVINSRGVAPVYMHAIWKLFIPLGVQFFLWLVSKNKVMTRDNLGKRREVQDPTCLFCGELEYVSHLLFHCVVVKRAWDLVSEVLGSHLISDYESLAKLWLCNKKHGVLNIVCSAVCWGLWKLRNCLCFQGLMWTDIQLLWVRVLPILRSWRILMPLQMADCFEATILALERGAMLPERIQLGPVVNDGAGSNKERWFKFCS